jgi:hypothetical protein
VEAEPTSYIIFRLCIFSSCVGCLLAMTQPCLLALCYWISLATNLMTRSLAVAAMLRTTVQTWATNILHHSHHIVKNSSSNRICKLWSWDFRGSRLWKWSRLPDSTASQLTTRLICNQWKLTRYWNTRHFKSFMNPSCKSRNVYGKSNAVPYYHEHCRNASKTTRVRPHLILGVG